MLPHSSTSVVAALSLVVVSANAATLSEAERELQRRLERHDQLDIRDLSTEQRERYVAEWRDVQRRFVDDPEGTLKRVAGMGYQEVETYGFDPEGLRYYGLPAKEFAQRLRPMSAFPDAESLMAAIAQDVTDTRRILGV